MGTDSSSGPLPSSSRLTIDSSSSIARSKGRRLTSEWVSSAMLGSMSRTLYNVPLQGGPLSPDLVTRNGGCKSSGSGDESQQVVPLFNLHQGGDVGGDRIG